VPVPRYEEVSVPSPSRSQERPLSPRQSQLWTEVRKVNFSFCFHARMQDVSQVLFLDCYLVDITAVARIVTRYEAFHLTSCVCAWLTKNRAGRRMRGMQSDLSEAPETLVSPQWFLRATWVTSLIRVVDSGHGCPLKCHAPFSCKEDTPCPEFIEAKCPCGNLKQRVLCGSCVVRPGGGQSRNLSCNDQCAIVQRNQRLAAALQVDTSNTERNGLSQATYDEDMLVFMTENLVRVPPLVFLTFPFFRLTLCGSAIGVFEEH
jgi:hypothetical protein